MRILFPAAASLSFLLLSCGNSHISKSNGADTLHLPAFNKEGHRGTRGMMPENTLPAMYKAIDYDVNTVEVDVVFSKDKQVVISHDLYFHPDITTTPEGKTISAKEAQQYLLYNMAYDSIRKFDVGLKPHPEFPLQKKMPAYKPLLGELLDSTNSYAHSQGKSIMYNIELKTNAATDETKTPPVEEFVDRVMDVVKQKKMEGHCYLQSFDFRPMQLLHRKYPGIVTAILISDKDKRTLSQQLEALGYTPQMYSPHYSLVTPQLVAEFHQRNIKLIPWTVNTVADMKRVKEMGVDGIITDYPNYFSQL